MFSTPPGFMPWWKVLRIAKEYVDNYMLAINNLEALKVEAGALSAPALSELHTHLLTYASVTEPLVRRVPPVCVSGSLINAFMCTEIPAMEAPPYAYKAFFFLLPEQSRFSFVTVTEHPADEGVLIATAVTADYIAQIIPIYWACSTTSDFELAGTYGDDCENIDWISNSAWIHRFVKNALLALSYRPDLTTEYILGSGGLPKSNRSKGNKCHLSARWMGHNFQNNIEPPKFRYSQGSEPNGTVRPHWRRGHWHTVCCGPGRRERKQQWFQPVYVNPIVSEEATPLGS